MRRVWSVSLLLIAGCLQSQGTGDGGVASGSAASFDYPLDDELRFHQLQAKSTHNSYHLEPDGNELQAWAYSHLPLDRQMREQGVRHLELDIRLSPALDAFEVFHLPVIDEQTSCRAFVACLATVEQWSRANPAHHPIVVQIEVKSGHPGDAAVEAFFTRLHQEIESVWPRDRIITPDEVRAGRATLGEAVAELCWPTLGTLRGRVMFTIDDGGAFRDSYSRDGTSLDGRLLFSESQPGTPTAAITVLNDPLGSADAIAAALAANMLVRTRADVDSEPLVSGDTTQRDAALASGAQFVSTDHPVPSSAGAYGVDIPGGTPSRCNPVTAPPSCRSRAIEDPQFMQP
jgi:hypothetical protein